MCRTGNASKAAVNHMINCDINSSFIYFLFLMKLVDVFNIEGGIRAFGDLGYGSIPKI